MKRAAMLRPSNRANRINSSIHPRPSVRPSVHPSSILPIRSSVHPSSVRPSVYIIRVDDSESTTRCRNDRQTSGGHESADVVACRVTEPIGSLLTFLVGRLLRVLRVLLGVFAVGRSWRRVVAAVVGNDGIVCVLAGAYDGVIAGGDRRRRFVHRILCEGCCRAVLVNRRRIERRRVLAVRYRLLIAVIRWLRCLAVAGTVRVAVLRRARNAVQQLWLQLGCHIVRP